MKALYLLAVWLHILAAAAWIGGMLFLVLVLVPVTRRPAFREGAAALVEAVGRRFRWVGWVALGLLIASGVVQVAYRGFVWADVWSGRLWQGPFGQTLGVKLLLVAAILLLSALHDFGVGPLATAAWQAEPGAPEARRLRRQAAWIGRVNLLLGLAAVALGVLLVRGWP